MNNIITKTGRYARSFLISLFTEKIDRKKFDETYLETKESYLKNRSAYDYKEYAMPEWQENTDSIENYFLNGFSMSFLRNKVIKKTMFMYTFRKWKNIQKELIDLSMDKAKAKEILRECSLGKPLLNDWEYASSGNNIHHLYHLLKFFKETGAKMDDVDTIVEVGGGYGNMAKIFKKIHPDSTYTIVDIPIFSYIQILYLRILFGKDSVKLISGSDKAISKGKINIIPLNGRDIIEIGASILNTDLFISTWALSESNKEMQDLVKKLRYFNAKYLLLAYQKSNDSFGFAENIKDVKPDYSTVFDAETEYLKDNFYLFAKRVK